MTHLLHQEVSVHLAKGASAAEGLNTAHQSATVYFRATELIAQKIVACYISSQHSGNAADLYSRCTTLKFQSTFPTISCHMFIGEAEVQLYSFLTSTLDGGEFSASRPGHSTPRKRAPYPLNRRRVGTPEPVWRFWRRDEITCPCQVSNPRPCKCYGLR